MLVAPGELCASAQVAAVGPGHHMVRSAMTGMSEVMVTDTDSSARLFGQPGITSRSTQMLKRLLAPTAGVPASNPLPTRDVQVVPSLNRYVAVTWAGTSFGLPIRMKRSKNCPVAPSAKNQ